MGSSDSTPPRQRPHKPRVEAPPRNTFLDALVPSLRFMSGLVIAALLIAGLYAGASILVPLALAFLLSFVLEPLVGGLKRIGLPRQPAVIAVVAATLMALGVMGMFLGKEARELSAELPSYQTNIRTKLRALRAELRAPGMFDGAKKTLDIVQREVEAAAPDLAGRSAQRAPRAQQVQVLPPPTTPTQQALAALGALGGPLTQAGLVLIFVIFILLDRVDLRDRLLRLWGADLHRATDAMDEAGDRISRYLTMQLLVNVTYGIPMGLGLWLIGIPGALLWGAVAAVMRFVPYVGPLIAAAFPVTLAFAVDPGWSLVLWTIGLIVLLELVSNNVIEPWLYGSSTGLSALSLIVAATFWTALWGPVGLIMSTPLTVCLLVVGRYLPQLAFLDVLLGSRAVLDESTRIYQRLLADDAEEAIELSVAQVEALQNSVPAFYAQVGLPVLRMAVGDHARVATPEHRLRLMEGMDELLDDLQEQYPSPIAPQGVPPVACMGGKWEVDHLAGRMAAHALSLRGSPAQAWGAAPTTAEPPEGLEAVRVACVVWLSPQPAAAARHACRRLRRRWPHLRIVLALWGEPLEALPEQGDAALLGADAVATSLEETLAQVALLQGGPANEAFEAAPIPADDAERVRALRDSGALESEALRRLCQYTAQRAADIFDVPFAMISLVDEARQLALCTHGSLPAAQGQSDGPLCDALPREHSVCGHVVASGEVLAVPDITRDARFAGNPALRERGVRFYAGAPLRDAAGHVLGTLCLMDTEPHPFDKRETRLLQAMAADLMKAWAQTAEASPGGQGASEPAHSATVGQIVP